ncbi:hypothetical protein Goari_011473, partial [Gossypium aridum]|nr:hypothetical protein [Gossypium aridum]
VLEDILVKVRKFIVLVNFVVLDFEEDQEIPILLGRGKVRFLWGTLGNRSSGDEVGPLAQMIRARGYEPWRRGFESLLAHNWPKREGPFPL